MIYTFLGSIRRQTHAPSRATALSSKPKPAHLVARPTLLFSTPLGAKSTVYVHMVTLSKSDVPVPNKNSRIWRSEFQILVARGKTPVQL
jgi:hypothetical protein